MRIRFAFVLLALLGIQPAAANVRTVEVSLLDRGFGSGLQLRSRESSSVFFTLPRPANISKLRLRVEGQVAAPSLYRGSLLVTVNGQPVDTFAPSRADGIQPFQREIEIDRRLIAADGSMNLRFEADLLASSDPCSNDFDPSNVISIFPTTGITFDIDLAAVQSLTDAVQLLPRDAQILLPADQRMLPAAAKAALHLAVLMIAHGADPRVQTVRDDSAVVIRLRHTEGEPPSEDAAILEHHGDKLDVVIDPTRDVIALTRLWQIAPATIMGKQATASRSAAPDEHERTTFREFSLLPPAQTIRQTGEWSLNFPLLAEDGRLTDRALLKIAVAPDWSIEPPIATVYLNGQFVTAARLSTGDNDVGFPLPRQMLNFNNSLRVVVERANDRRFCIPPTGGHAAQIMPGSGVTFGNESGTGFARIAHRLVNGGAVVLPVQARDPAVAGRYILFAAKILAAFGSNAEDIDVTFGEPPAANGKPARTAIVFETAGPEGLQIPIPSRAERLNLQPLAASSLVGLFSDPDGSRLRVVLSKPDQVPAPPALNLRGGGANALVSAGGVIWYDAPDARVSMFDGFYTSASDLQRFLERYGLALLGGFAIFILLVILSRRILVLYFRGRASR